jgi:hypothetical protein
MRRFFIAVATLVLLSPSANAQTTPIDISPLSGRLLPTSPPSAVALFPAALERRTTYLLLPFYLNTDGLWLGMVNGAAVFPTEKPTRVDLTYTYLKPDGADHLNSFGATIRNTVLAKPGVGKITLLAAYSDTHEASTKAQAGGVAEYALPGRPVTLNVDLRWVRSSAGDGTSDIIPKLGIGYDFRGHTLAGEYTFENEVDGESDYSVELDLTTRPGIVIIGAGKNQTVFVGFLRIF